MPLPPSVLRRAREKQYAEDVHAFYGPPRSQSKTAPCVDCGHAEDEHDVFDGPCREPGCTCKAFRKIQVGQEAS